VGPNLLQLLQDNLPLLGEFQGLTRVHSHPK
jgi:hypothetical protein